MPLQFTVLASGSTANASLLDIDGRGVLIDLGLGPRQLHARLTALGTSWARVRAALVNAFAFGGTNAALVVRHREDAR